jgi:hypothetical protein
VANCRRGERVVGGGVRSYAGFAGGRGMMINTSEPFDDGDQNRTDDDGSIGVVDAFDNASNPRIVVTAICME